MFVEQEEGASCAGGAAVGQSEVGGVDVDHVQRAEQLKAAASDSFEKGQLSDAESYLTAALSELHHSATSNGAHQRHARSVLLSNRAAVCLAQDRPQDAVNDAEAAIEEDSAWHRPYQRLSSALLALGRLSEAAAALRAGLTACKQAEQPAGEDEAPAPPAAELQSALEVLQAALDARKAKSGSSKAPRLEPGGGAAGQGVEAASAGPVPVTVLCGFLGSGKTTLLTRLAAAAAQQGVRLGLVVNDLASLNVDAALLTARALQGAMDAEDAGVGTRGLSSLGATSPATDPATGPATGPAAAPATAPAAEPECGGPRGAAGLNNGRHQPQPQPQVVELTGGCVCCTLSGDLVREVQALLAPGRGGAGAHVDRIIIEATGVGAPEPLAAALARLPPGTVHVDCMVTVLDISEFLHHVDSLPLLPTHMPAHTQGAAAGCSASSDPSASNCGGSSSLGPVPAAAAGAAAPPPTSPPPPIGHLMVEQVECADVVLLNKCDLLSLEAHSASSARAATCTTAATDASAPCTAPGTSTVLPSAPQVPPALARPDAASRAVALVRALNPTAAVRTCAHCDVPLGPLLRLQQAGHRTMHTPPHAPAAVAAAGGEGPGGESGLAHAQGDPSSCVTAQQHAQQQHVPETELYDIRSLVFEKHRPFHPARLWELLQGMAAASTAPAGSSDAQAAAVRHTGEEGAEAGPSGRDSCGRDDGGGASMWPPLLPPLLRAKGTFWIASLPDAMWEMSFAGGRLTLQAAGRWLASMVAREHWPEGGRPGWHARWGDRQQGLVFIGQGLSGSHAAALTAALQACLITAGEAQEGEEAWVQWDDAAYLQLLQPE